MGAEQFMTTARGATADEAFRSAVEAAQWEHGHGGYSGTIAEKDEFVTLEIPPGVASAGKEAVRAYVSAAMYAEFPPGKSWRWEHDQPEYREPFHEGCVIAVARIAGCHFATDCDREVNDFGRLEYCSEWAMPDQHHWVLDDVRLLPEPVPHKGTLGLRPLPDEVESAVRAQLGEK